MSLFTFKPSMYVISWMLKAGLVGKLASTHNVAMLRLIHEKTILIEACWHFSGI